MNKPPYSTHIANNIMAFSDEEKDRFYKIWNSDPSNRALFDKITQNSKTKMSPTLLAENVATLTKEERDQLMSIITQHVDLFDKVVPGHPAIKAIKNGKSAVVTNLFHRQIDAFNKNR